MESTGKEHPNCCACGAEKMEYRIFYGSSYEGYSIREVYLDQNNRVIGWGRSPLSPLAASSKEVREDIVDMMKNLDDMLDGAKKPALDELVLENTKNNRLHNDHDHKDHDH